jgi:hypothetical protein
MFLFIGREGYSKTWGANLWTRATGGMAEFCEYGVNLPCFELDT